MDWSYIGGILDIGETFVTSFDPVYYGDFPLRIITPVESIVEYTAIYIVDFVQTIWLICQLMEFRLELWNSYAICISW